MSPAPLPSKPGRPRSATVRLAILEATLDLLRSAGYARLTIEAVAAHAKAGKATIYRWWPNKAALVAEAVWSGDEQAVPFPDTGSVREDFRRHLQLVAQVLESPRGRLVARLVGAGLEDHELQEAFRKQFLSLRRGEAQQIWNRGVRRGELRPEVFSDAAIDALYGPLYFRWLSGLGGMTADYVDAICDVAMLGALRVRG